MKTKAQIVQELLEKKAITAEEAVTLLMADAAQVPVYITPPSYPAFPWWPWTSPLTYPSIPTYITISEVKP